MARLSRVAAIAVLAASACAGDPGSRTGVDPSGGPVLVVARSKDAVHLDPAQANEGISLNVTTEVMKGLVKFRIGTFDVEPAIAQSWQMSADGLMWTFELKRGLQFSDGTRLDAAAVKFNFDRWRLAGDPYHGSYSYQFYHSMFGGFPGLIRDVRATGPYTVAFILARPFAPFLHDLAMPAFAIGSPAAIRSDLQGFDAHPVGWGPYVLTEWTKGRRIVLSANQKYESTPRYRTVVLLEVADPSSLAGSMEEHRIDVAVDPMPVEVASLARTPGVTLYYQPANDNAYLAMNNERQPFDKLAVRRAIAYALDVRAIVRDDYPAGAVVGDTWTPPGMVPEDPSIKAYSVDLERARALLASAGFPHGFHTQLVYSNTARPYLPDPTRVAGAIVSQLRRIGIIVKAKPLEWPVFLNTTKHGEHRMCLAGWSGDNGDPDDFLYTLLDSDSARAPNALNYAFWRDPRFHTLMLQGQETSDSLARARIYQEANAMVHEMVPSIPIAHVASPVAMRTAIAGFIPAPDTHIAFEDLRPVDDFVGL